MFMMENKKEIKLKSYYHSAQEFATLCTDFENKKNLAMISMPDKTEKITDVLQHEITTFQQSNDSFQFTQRVLEINPERTVPDRAKEEVCFFMQQNAPFWNIKVVKSNAAAASIPMLFNTIDRYSLVKTAIDAGIISNSKIKEIVLAVVVFVAMLCAGWFGLMGAGLVSGQRGVIALILAGCVSLTGAIVGYYLFRKRSLSDNAVFTELANAVRNLTDSTNEKYTTFVSSIAVLLVSKLPSVIILDELTEMDICSRDIIRNILQGDNRGFVGAVLWLMISKKPINKVFLLDTLKNVSIKKYSYR
jgi:hypothetical protein